MTGHAHLIETCQVHGVRLGGCRCMDATGGAWARHVPCPDWCPGREPASEDVHLDSEVSGD